MELFITSGPGLEAVLEEELKQLGIQHTRTGYRGVYVDDASMKDVFKINYCSQVASRVLLPILHFRCEGRDDLYQAFRSIQWKDYIRVSKTFAIDASVDHPRLRNSLFAAQVGKDAIVDQFMDRTGKRPSINTDSPDVQLNLYIRGGKGTISFDTSCTPLHKRGYRLEGGEAPLKETLAAALLKIGNFSSEEIFIDPFAGSATFLIEACLMASKTPPGLYRKRFGFFDLPHFDEREWLQVKVECDSLRIPLKKGQFFGVEINKNTYRIALSNLKTSGFQPFVEMTNGDFREFQPKVLPNFLITNPPWGRRLEEESSLAPLYRDLGDFMKRKMAKPARGFVLTASMPLSKEIGLAAKRRHVIESSGLESRFLEFDLY